MASQQPDAQQDEGINNEGMMDIEAAILALEAETAKEEERDAASTEPSTPPEKPNTSTPAEADGHTTGQVSPKAQAPAAAASPRAQAPAASPKPAVADPFEIATAAAEHPAGQAEGSNPATTPAAPAPAVQKPAVKSKKRQLTLGSVRKPAADAAPSDGAGTPDKSGEPASGAAAKDAPASGAAAKVAADAPAKKKPAVPRMKGLEVAGGVGKPASGGGAKPKTAAKAKAKCDKQEKKGKAGKKNGAKPLRAKSAYQLFCAEKRGNYKDLSMGEVSKKLGELWKGMGEEDKEPFEASAKEDKERVTALKAEAGNDGEAAGGAGKEKKPKKEKKLTIKSAYMLFCSDKRAEVKADNPDVPFPEMAKLLGAAWNDATPDEKAVYQEQHAMLKQEAEANVTLPPPKTRAPKKSRATRPAAAKKQKVEDDDEDDHEAIDEAEDEAAADAADAAAHSDADSDDDEAQRMNCEWDAHPAECILAHTFTNKYLVKRKGCDYTEYGVVDAQAAKRQRLAAPAAGDGAAAAAPACPVSLAQIDNYEAFLKSFKRARFEREDKHGGLDLDELPEGSPLEMCYYLGKLQEEGQLLSKIQKKRGNDDVMIKLPAMGLSMLMQRAVEAERADKAAAEARAARLAAHNVLLWAALPPGTDIPDMPAEGKGADADATAAVSGGGGSSAAEGDENAAPSQGDEGAAAEEPSDTAALVKASQKAEQVPAMVAEA